MRIASINQDRGISPGRSKGAAVHLQAMREAFRELGCTVDAFDFAVTAELERALEDVGPESIDLVYERYALGKDAGARFAARHGIPVVLEVNAPLADEAARYRETAETDEDRARDRYLFQQACCVLAVSTQVAHYAVDRGARQESLLVRPNGIDTARFNPAVDGTPIRDGRVCDDSMVLGFHGRERPWHGFEHLVAAVERLLSRGRPVHLMLVGNGDFDAAKRLPADKCHRFGWQQHEDMPAFVAAFDVLPLTYQPDTPFYFSPLKLMEAMACGVVPVVPDMGDLATIVRHGENGLVYPAGDNLELDRALDRLATDAAFRKRLGKRAAEDARQFTWANIAQDVLDRVGSPPALAAAEVAK